MSKTCGECKYYKPYNEKICLYVHRHCVPPKTRACSNFASATVFDHITESVEVLAEKLVYKKIHNLPYDQVSIIWRSTLISHKEFHSEAEAIVATIEELKKEWKK